MKSIPFEVTLADQYSVIIPEKHVQPFVDKKLSRVKIKASFNEQSIEYHAALKKEKTGLVRTYFSKAKQKELGIFVNDYFTIQLFEDQSKYGVEMPESLDAVLLSDYEAFQIFESFTPGKQRSIIYAIKRIKNVQTQVDKSIIMTDNLKRGITDLKLLFKN
ncbi:YdeI/OmpD-associated family protein [Olleya aquimaris]|uniref:Bacteriocin resistance YdeI/OmpD-like protein n=1 Tax=Olleya aquimaris TaxID=639310 RepID=A0A327RT08_9FLAO|nr:YdeI/OmpD-associated family protein [Olleya aquimaris]RAJ16857.1 bacteriocin resistance YdeI/OmpD-like protein [Olleya aquimaris]